MLLIHLNYSLPRANSCVNGPSCGVNDDSWGDECPTCGNFACNQCRFAADECLNNTNWQRWINLIWKLRRQFQHFCGRGNMVAKYQNIWIYKRFYYLCFMQPRPWPTKSELNQPKLTKPKQPRGLIVTIVNLKLCSF